jgi:hypothetical protein
VSRGAFYGWLNRHFKLGAKEPVLEQDYRRLSRDELTVWDEKHPRPKSSGPDFERQLTRWFYQDAQRQLASQANDRTAWRQTMNGALDIVFDGGIADVGDVEWDMKNKEERGSWLFMSGLLRNKTRQQEVPAVFCHPKQWNGRTVLWLHPDGKGGLFGADGSPLPEIGKVLDSGATVVGLDLLYQGEFLTNNQPLTRVPKVKNSREAAAYTFGYNRSVFVHRVHDVLGAVKFVQGHERQSKEVIVVGGEGVGAIAAAARALSDGAINRAIIDTAGFRFADVPDIYDPNFVPGAAKYGDLLGLLAYGQGALLLAGEGEKDLKFITSTGADSAVKVVERGRFTADTVAWLTRSQ